MVSATDVHELPRWAVPAEADLAAMVCAELRRRDARLDGWWVEPVDHRIVSPGTAGLHRVRGVARAGAESLPWSLFVKLVHSPQHIPAFAVVPDEVREWARTSFAWDYEVQVYWSGLREAMPRGLRLPRLYRVDDSGDRRLAMWLEDVRIAPDAVWDLPRFRRAATLLGRLNAVTTVRDLLPAGASRVPGEVLRMATRGFVQSLAIPALLDDAVWRHPLIAGMDPALRDDLGRLAQRIPELLDALDRLPQLMTHGDACPQNLLVPADDPDGFVPIDWSAGGLAAVGCDLGQLVIGEAHAGRLAPGRLRSVIDAVVEAYAVGLAAEGIAADESDIRYGAEATLVMRSAFLSIPLDRLGEEPTDDLAEHIAERIRLTRRLVDLGQSL